MNLKFNRYRRIWTKVDANIFDSALSHTRRSDASEKREENSVSTFGRFRLWTSFESSLVSVNNWLFSLQFEDQENELNNIIVKFCQIFLNCPRRRLTEQYSP